VDNAGWWIGNRGSSLAGGSQTRSNVAMSTLAVIAYPQEKTASEAAAKIVQMQKDYVIDLQDVAWVTKRPDGKLKLHQSVSTAGAGAAGGAFWVSCSA
jgi:uncharacterized membrane protein